MKIGNGKSSVAEAGLSTQSVETESALFREISKTRFEQTDVLEEMQRRFNELETLHARLQFMMSEISGLVRRH